uniref:Small ribosomal subunit protein bS6c n=1 Tax=Galaxaura rugosa TaxID=268570 RepID=A0A1G4NSL0_9FLOR|nr:Ribosomal protein S6 [Galaxaura rugosa]SCW21658.1 Ribosomal protein S6 [Galaxaura rugosa]
MVLNHYETIYIVRPDIIEDTSLLIVNEYKTMLKKNGGQNIFVQHRGRRHLSYNIKNYYDGIYVQINFEGNGYLVSLLEKSMKFNDAIIRYITIKQVKSQQVTI